MTREIKTTRVPFAEEMGEYLSGGEPKSTTVVNVPHEAPRPSNAYASRGDFLNLEARVEAFEKRSAEQYDTLETAIHELRADHLRRAEYLASGIVQVDGKITSLLRTVEAGFSHLNGRHSIHEEREKALALTDAEQKKKTDWLVRAVTWRTVLLALGVWLLEHAAKWIGL